MRRLVFFISSILACVWAQAIVYTPSTLPNPQSHGSYVCNPDNIIESQEVTFMNQLATQLEDSTDVELCIVAVQSIGEMEAFDFCYELFQRWGIGKKGKNTGVLVFLALESRDIRIMTGGGIESVLTDAICHNIVQQTAIPPMKRGDYSGGLSLTALHIYEECTHDEVPEELRNMTSATNRYQYGEEEDEPTMGMLLLWGVIFCSIPIFFIWLASRPKICPKCKQRAFRHTKDQIITHSTLKTTGLGVHIYHCKHCGHYEEKTYVIPRKSPVVISGGSGGFSGGSFGGGFGGGSTFGGGAGGKF